MAYIQDKRKQCRGWVLRYDDPDVPGRERSKAFTRKADAEAYRDELVAQVRRHEWVPPERLEVAYSDWAARWMAANAHLKPKTRATYDDVLRTLVLPRFGALPLGRIEQVDVREWIAGMLAAKRSASRVRQGYRALASSLKAAVDASYLVRTPCRGIKLPPAASREVSPFTAAEVERLAAGVKRPADAALIRFLGYTGARWGEAAALRRRRCDVDLRGRVEIRESVAEISGTHHFGATKNYESRTLLLPDYLRGELAEHLAHDVAADKDALVFTAPAGGPLRHSNWRKKVWLPALEACQLTGRIHDLRHTAASLMIGLGGSPKLVQTQLGHKTISVTFDVYGHLFPDESDRLAVGMDEVARNARSALDRDETGTGNVRVIAAGERSGR